MTEQRAINSRRSLRKSPHRAVTVECRSADSENSQNLAAHVLDISEGGARLSLSKKLRRGQIVEVTFNCPAQAKPIKRLATVRWIESLDADQYGVGLQFEKRLLFADVLNISDP